MKVDELTQCGSIRLGCLRSVSLLVMAVALNIAAPTTAWASDDPPDPLVGAIGLALDEWSRFAATGDMTAIDTSFVPDGPQWLQFETESTAWSGPANPEPLRFEVRELRLRNLDLSEATVWAQVEASRPGFVSRLFSWDFDLTRNEGRWQVWTVVAAGEPSAAPHTPSTHPPDATETTTATATTRVASELRSLESGVASTGGRPTGIRLPVLSAWIVVITLVGVALAGYMAPRIDRRKEG